MTAFETHAHIGPDGTLTLRLPAGFEGSDVRVKVEKAAANGDGARADSSPAAGSRRDVLDRLYGSVPDFPDVERPGPEDYEERETWP